MDINIELSKWQSTVWDDPHRFKVIACGRRAGKTTLAAHKMREFAFTNKASIVWYVSPSYRQSEQIMWRMLRNYIEPHAIEKTNETKLQIYLKNGSLIELKGADTSPDSLRGVRIDFLVCDEVASFHNWDVVWSEVLRPTLIDSRGSAIFIGTPKGFNHFYDLYTQKDVDYISFKFTTYDNPYLSKEEIDKARKELTEDTFAQEFLADFRKYTGLVYKEFQRETHIIEPFDIPSGWSIYRSLDFGSTNPTAAIWIAVDNDDNWFVYKEHYVTGQTIDYHAGIINSESMGRSIQATYGDPSGAQWIQEFAQRGIYITPANKEIGQAFNTWVTFGIDKVAQKLKRIPGHVVSEVRTTVSDAGYSIAMPQLFIFSGCSNTIREFETYRWKEKKDTQAQDLNEPDVPEKANDHAMDALRYFAVSYAKQQPMYIPPQNDISLKDWSFR